MPRQPKTIDRDISLFLGPHVIIRGIHTYSDKLHRISEWMKPRHFDIASIRMGSNKREPGRMQTPAGSAVPVRSAQDGERV